MNNIAHDYIVHKVFGGVTRKLSVPTGRLPTMTDQPKRPDPPMTGDERTQLTTFLDYQRATVVSKCSGLTEEQARRAHVPSELTTIAGLLGHLTLNEYYWFSVVLDGQEDTWEEALKTDPDAEFRIALSATVPSLVEEYLAECERSRQIVAKLDLDAQVDFRGDRKVNVRWVVTHMVEETARHLGHLDLLRELTDGVTGE
jgi:uncharacterized damage-inducible protein DinB